jgi:hypothetical protein
VGAAEPAKREITPAERVGVLFDAMRSGAYQEREFPVLGWEHVPALLERAPSRARLKATPVNPLSSQFEPEQPESIVALWLIEGIHKGGRYPSLNPICNGGERGRTQQQAVQAYFRWWQEARKVRPSARAARNPFAGTKLSWY